MINKEVLAIILGGGRGTRLFPLTMLRAKPAVPVGGKFRLIDIPISNCINSGVSRIFIMTQFLSTSLNRHVSSTFGGPRLKPSFVDILPAIQTDEPVEDWFLGTADSIRKHVRTFLAYKFDHFLILSGDHLYMMDYNDLYRHHLATDADVTVSVTPVKGEDAGEFGIMKVDSDFRITEFFEKPKDKSELDRLYMSHEQNRAFGLEFTEPRCLGSMGVYLFKRQVLLDYLKDISMIDFGKDIIPDSINRFQAFAHPFADFWADIGTIKSFYRANLMLGYPDSKFDFYQRRGVIYSRPRFLPGSRVYGGKIINSSINEGCSIEGAEIEGSLVGIRTQIRKGTKISNTVIMGADYYDFDESFLGSGDTSTALGIGRDCSIEGAIIDKNARIGDGVVIRNQAGIDHLDGDGYFIRNGIVVIPKNCTIDPGTII